MRLSIKKIRRRKKARIRKQDQNFVENQLDLGGRTTCLALNSGGRGGKRQGVIEWISQSVIRWLPIEPSWKGEMPRRKNTAKEGGETSGKLWRRKSKVVLVEEGPLHPKERRRSQVS